MRVRVILSSIFLHCLFVGLPIVVKSQEKGLNWILNSIQKDSLGNTEIFEFHQDFAPTQGPLFWPKGISVPPYINNRLDQFIVLKGRLYLLLDGTGRVYEYVKATPEAGSLVRVDSTLYVGNTFNALGFSLHDTLFSIGGYGFWRSNGQLRYFDPVNHGWNLKPVDREIPFNYQQGYWIDHSQKALYLVTRRLGNEILKQSYGNEKALVDSSKVMKLDITRGNWMELGSAIPKMQGMLRDSRRIGSCPFGEVMVSLPLSRNQMFVLDYQHNRIWNLSPKLAASIGNFAFSMNGQEMRSGRTITYYHDSVFNLVSSDGNHLALSLTKKDLLPTDGLIYFQGSGATSEINTRRIVYFLSALLLVVGSVYFRKRLKRSTNSEKKEMALFTTMELNLIEAIQKDPENSLTTDAVNEILGTAKKNPDVQRKQRSDRIRAINRKFNLVTGIPDNLIIVEKSEDDKRTVRYRVQPEMLKKIKGGLND